MLWASLAATGCPCRSAARSSRRPLPCPAPCQALSLILDVLCGITAKEEDAAVREALAEAVLCLARADAGRKALWKADAPGLLQKGYEFEENATVCACMEATAELFLADGFQPAPEEVEGEGCEDGEGGESGEGGGGAGSEAAEPPAAAPGRVVHIEEID